MFKRLKEMIQPLSKKCPSIKVKSPFLISFKKLEEIGSTSQEAPNECTCEQKTDVQGENAMLQSQAEPNMYSVLADVLLFPFKELVPGISNSEHLLNLTDLRTADEGMFSSQGLDDGDSQPMPWCQEQPRPFFFGDVTTKDLPKQSPLRELDTDFSNPDNPMGSVDKRTMDEELCNIQAIDNYVLQVPRYQEQPRPFIYEEYLDKNVPEESVNKHLMKEQCATVSEDLSLKKLVGPEETNMAMDKILCDMLKKRAMQLKEYNRNNNIDLSKKYSIDTILQKDKKQRFQKQNSDIELNKILNNILRARELKLKDFDRNVQKNKNIIDITTVIENEEKNKCLQLKNKSRSFTIIDKVTEHVEGERGEKADMDVYTEIIKHFHKRRPKVHTFEVDKSVDKTMNSKEGNINTLKTYNLREMTPNLTDFSGVSKTLEVPPEKSFIRSLLEMNRTLENKIMTSKQLIMKTNETPLNLKAIQTNFVMSTNSKTGGEQIFRPELMEVEKNKIQKMTETKEKLTGDETKKLVSKDSTLTTDGSGRAHKKD